MKKNHLPKIAIAVVAIILVIAAIIFFSGRVSSKDSIISRSFSESNIHPGEEINVTLYVTIGKTKDTFFAIEEHIPSGWIVVNSNGGKTNDPQKLEWYSFKTNSLEDSSITYTLKAPNTPGKYSFSGIYGFESMDGKVANIPGKTSITVR